LFRSLGLLILAVTAAAIAVWKLRSDPETRATQLAWVDTWTHQFEDLLYGATGTDERNADAMVAASQAQLDLLKRVGKPVFAVEYVTRSGSLADARAELGSLGYIGVFPPRNLDGSDLIVNDIAAPETAANASGGEPETGTPENTQAKCDGVWKRAVERSPDERGDALPPSASMQ
jgi:hypothetical protein